MILIFNKPIVSLEQANSDFLLKFEQIMTLKTESTGKIKLDVSSINDAKINNQLQVCEVFNRVACSSNIVTVSRIRGPLTAEIIRQAFKLAQHRHPCLNYRIVGTLDDLKLETEGIPTIPLRVVRKPHSEQWQDILLEEANEKIDSSQALLRAVLFHPQDDTCISYLITTAHHGITDALANIQLHQDILTYCQNIASGKPIGKIDSLPVLPPIEALMPESVEGFRGKIDKFLFILRFVLKQLWHRPKTLALEKCVPLELRRSGFLHRQLDKELAQRLVSACKDENVTFQCALCTAMMFSAVRMIESDPSKAVSMNCCTTINMRKFLEPVISKEHINSLASFISSYHSLKANTSFWELARDVKQQLQDGLLDGDPFSQLRLVSKNTIKQLAKNPSQFVWTVIASSLQINIPERYGAFELEEINMTAASAAYGGIFSAGAIIFREKFCLNFFYSEPSISQETMESLADNVIFYLSEACEQKLAVVSEVTV